MTEDQNTTPASKLIKYVIIYISHYQSLLKMLCGRDGCRLYVRRDWTETDVVAQIEPNINFTDNVALTTGSTYRNS